MPNDYTNLLPKERRLTLKRNYYIRLSTICAFLATLVFIFSIALLAPSYFYVHNTAVVKKQKVAELDATLGEVGGGDLAARITVLKSDIAKLERLSHKDTGSAVLKNVLGVSRSGVALTGFTFRPGMASTSASLLITGIARKRDALRTYEQALKAAPFAETVELPVAVFAKDTDIPFTITLTLRP